MVSEANSWQAVEALQRALGEPGVQFTTLEHTTITITLIVTEHAANRIKERLDQHVKAGDYVTIHGAILTREPRTGRVQVTGTIRIWNNVLWSFGTDDNFEIMKTALVNPIDLNGVRYEAIEPGYIDPTTLG